MAGKTGNMVKGSKSQKTYIMPVLIVTGCLTGAGAILLSVISVQLNIHSHVITQLMYVCTLFGISGLFLFFENETLSFFVFPIKLFCFFFISNALGSVVLPLICFLFAYCLETSCISNIRLAPILVLPALGILFLGTKPSSSWDTTRATTTMKEFIILLLVAVAATLLGVVSRNAIQQKDAQKKEILRLEETVGNLAKTNNTWQTYATYIEETSKEEERHRISREIHDIIGYSMTNLLMLVQAAIYSENQDKITELLQKAQAHINDSLNEVRMAMRKLRSTQKKMLHGSDLLQNLAQNFGTVTGIDVDIEFISFPRKIDRPIEEILYRMVQEAMTNSFRHGRATEIQISLWLRGQTIVTQIRDNGQKKIEGPLCEGIGLQGMRERITQAGGTFSTEFAKDGFTINATIPIVKDTREDPYE